MTEFEDWVESGEYKKDTKNHQLSISTESVNGMFKVDILNQLEYTEICFHKGFEKGYQKGLYNNRLEKCDNNENKLRKAKDLLRDARTFILNSSDYSEELNKDLKTILIRMINEFLNIDKE